MKKFMLMAVCLMMALSVVSCSDDGDDEDEGVNLVIWNDTGYYVNVSEASVGSYDIIEELWSGNDLIIKDDQVYFGSPETDGSGLASANEISIPHTGTFTASYQVLDDSDGNSDNTDSATLPYVDVSGEIHSSFTLEAGKTYLVYFSTLAEDTSEGDGNVDRTVIYEVGSSWERADMTTLTADTSSCTTTTTGVCP
ncbi:MAG TPA: hypothetical protein PK859_08000 [Spirochaetota bacterium]|nr:hypothetical protein [Spirochaetota bacterium]HPR48946.1 hypothetical protein [Spirochaetota bacterium]